MRYRIPLPKGVPGWMPFFAIGLLNNVLPFSLIVIGQTYVSSGLASILNATTPLFTIVVMAVAGEEKLSARRIAGLVAGLAGVIVLHGGGSGVRSRPGHRHPALPGRRLQLRTVGAAGAALCWQTRRRWEQRHFRLLASAAMMTIVAGVVDRPWQLPVPERGNLARGDRSRGPYRPRLAYIVFFQILRRSRRDQRHAGDAC